MAKDTSPNYYEVLGVSSDAPLEEINQAYRKLAKRSHPDAGGSTGLFRHIAAAHTVLSDPAKRSEYDRHLADPRHHPAEESARRARERAADERETSERRAREKEGWERETRERETWLANDAKERVVRAQRKARRTIVITVSVACLALAAVSTVMATRKGQSPDRGARKTAAGPTAARPVAILSNYLTAEFGWGNSDVCQLRADGYHVIGDAGTCRSSIEFTDGDITVDVRTIVGGLAGISFRVSDTALYFFQILPTGEWSLQSSGDGMRQVTLLRRNSAIATGNGSRNTLRVRVRGTHFEFFANGVKLGKADDDAYREGRLGLFGYTLMGSPNEVVFTNLRIIKK